MSPVSPVSLCWFVSRIRRKQLNRFPSNLDGGRVSAQNRSTVSADLYLRIQDFFLTFFNIVR